MINEPLPFKGLNIRIPIIIPIKGRGLLIMGLGYTDSLDLRLCEVSGNLISDRKLKESLGAPQESSRPQLRNTP